MTFSVTSTVNLQNPVYSFMTLNKITLATTVLPTLPLICVLFQSGNFLFMTSVDLYGPKLLLPTLDVVFSKESHVVTGFFGKLGQQLYNNQLSKGNE